MNPQDGIVSINTADDVVRRSKKSFLQVKVTTEVKATVNTCIALMLDTNVQKSVKVTESRLCCARGGKKEELSSA